MRVTCSFDSKTDVDRNNNVLRVENSINNDMVKITILDKDGKIENESVVDGHELIKAIQNAMNWKYRYLKKLEDSEV